MLLFKTVENSVDLQKHSIKDTGGRSRYLFLRFFFLVFLTIISYKLLLFPFTYNQEIGTEPSMGESDSHLILDTFAKFLIILAYVTVSKSDETTSKVSVSITDR